jgi:HPt (histidine-containing phosphotransfer) domain-containing protein
MNSQIIFKSPEIDAEYLNTLYEGDKDILVPVFEEYLSTLPEILEKLSEGFRSNQPALMKQVAHKYKSTFSYTGFTNISQSMKYIEEKCGFLTSLDELKADFEQAISQIEGTKFILENELQALR